MSDQLPVLRSRSAPAVAPARSPADAELELELRKAHQIAKAGDAIPKGYRANPGAVLLAMEWAQHHGMTLLQALQCVSFVQGRPVVDATAQRALAERAGYLVLPTEISEDSCTVTVSRDGQTIGQASYSLDDAKRANLLGKDNWRTAPQDMLVARATGRAVRRFAPGVLFGLSTPDEIDDPLEIPARPGLLDAELVQPAVDPGQLTIHDVDELEPEVLPDDGNPGSTDADDAGPAAMTAGPAEPAELEPWPNVAALRAELRERGISTPDAVRAAAQIAVEIGESEPGSMTNVVDHGTPELVQRFAVWVRQQGAGS